MSTETETTTHTAETMTPPSGEEGLTDAELSAKRGLSHKDGPKEPMLRMRDRIAAAARRHAASAGTSGKEGEAP